jgi:HTH-type transcriptional regulator, competence development regulator
MFDFVAFHARYLDCGACGAANPLRSPGQSANVNLSTWATTSSDTILPKYRQNERILGYRCPSGQQIKDSHHACQGGSMAQAALGFLLRNLREERGLSLRELAQLADIDHAYVHRLETGAKESPSEEVLSRLIRALKAPKREADMLRYLAAHPDADAGFVAHVRQDATVTIDEFASAAGMVFRGAARPDYATRIERVRRILKEEDGRG